MFILYNPSDKSSPNSLNPDLVWASSMAQTVKNPPAMWETWARSLGWEDPLEKGRLPTPAFWPGEFQSMGSQRVGHN